MGALTRPIGQVLLPLWALVILGCMLRQRASFWRTLACTALFVAAGPAYVLPWAFRNQRLDGDFTLSPIDTWNLGYNSAPYTLARAKGISVEAAWEQVLTSRVFQPGGRGRYGRILLEHPLDYLYVHWRGTWYLLSEVGQPNLAQLVGERYQTPGFLVALRQGDARQAAANLLAGLRDPVMRWFLLISWPSMAFQLAIYLLALKTVSMLPRQPVAQRIVVALAVLAAAAFILVPGPVGTGRFRLPAEPLLCLLVAVGIASCGRAHDAAGWAPGDKVVIEWARMK
jgi:hypothetical protein